MSTLVLAGAAACALLICAIWLITGLGFLSEHYAGRPIPSWLKVILTILLWAGACAGGIYWRLNQTAKPSETAKEGFVSETSAIVHPLEQGWYFESWGYDTAIILYGERGVEASAYAPLCKAIAKQGMDCWLPEMPYSIPDFDYEAAAAIMAKDPERNWYMMCHGDGNEAAGKFFTEHQDEFAGMIVLDTWPAAQLDASQLLITVVAEDSTDLDIGRFSEAMALQKAKIRQNTIRGGSHAGFADCETSAPGNPATVSSSLQAEKTAQLLRQTLIGEKAGRESEE